MGVIQIYILFFCLTVVAASPPASSRAADAAGSYSIAFQTLHWKPNITNEIMGARFSVHTLHWKTRTDTTTGALTHINIYVKERLFIRLDRLFIIYFLYLCTRLNRGSAWWQTTGCKHGLTIGLARYRVYDRPLTPPIGLFFWGGSIIQNPLAPPFNHTGLLGGYVFMLTPYIKYIF